MAKKRGNITALYERLSRDDEQFGDSISIVNQKNMLESYAQQNGFINIRHYTDDGYSGGSFERPGWKKMIEDIEDGKISTVIAKDMSRIGRNYLEVGYFTEIFFGQKNIRFIAVSNNVDSDNQGSSEFAPFLNIMNEWYLRDCSNKIKASKRSLGTSGKAHLAPVPCYGYKKDPADKRKWIVDEEAAEVVRLIYKLCIDGNGTQQISRILRERKIVTPGYHSALNGVGRYKNNIEALEPYNWNSGTVRDILTRPEYLGYTVNFRTTSKSYKEKKNIVNSPDKWAVFEGTQEPIIDRYTYQLVQKLLSTPRRSDTLGEANPLTGLVFCADCGAKMYNHRAKPYTTRTGHKFSGFDGYDCSAYKLSSRKTRGPCCSSHHIGTKALREVVLYTIQNACKYAIEDKEAFVEKVKKEAAAHIVNTERSGKRQYAANKKRFQELDKLYMTLYESFAAGVISEDKFKMISDSYESEQKKLQTDIKAYENWQSEKRKTDDDIESFYALIDKYTNIDELTPPVLNEFVDKILVHRAEKIENKRVQKVEVYLNFVGKIDLPKTEDVIDPEQERIKQYWKDRYQRTKDYESARRKKINTCIAEQVEANKKASRERIIRQFNEEADAIGVENMSVVPASMRDEEAVG